MIEFPPRFTKLDMTFPERSYEDIEHYCDDYMERLTLAAASVDRSRVKEAAERLLVAFRTGATVYVCGNGGSAAISNHLTCDHLKCIQTDTSLTPRVVSLSANMELVTAIANDIGFEDAFVYQLRTLARPGDVLVTISSSGDSDNIVRAVRWACDNGVTTIALTGFSGGRSASLADTNIHVAADNYGIIEDIHQSVMHILAQHLRQVHMSAQRIADTRF